MISSQQKNRLLILVIFGMALIPFLMAWTLKDNPRLARASTNHGRLIMPPITTDTPDFSGFDAFSRANMSELKSHWLMAIVIADGDCSQTCLEALYKTRQIRLMLSKDLPRTRRLAVLFKPVDPKLAERWWQRENAPKSAGDSAGQAPLTGPEAAALPLPSDLIRVMPSEPLRRKIARSDSFAGKPAFEAPPTGTLLLIDPLGNIMMYYPPGFNPYHVKSDLVHLLNISQIG